MQSLALPTYSPPCQGLDMWRRALELALPPPLHPPPLSTTASPLPSHTCLYSVSMRRRIMLPELGNLTARVRNFLPANVESLKVSVKYTRIKAEIEPQKEGFYSDPSGAR